VRREFLDQGQVVTLEVPGSFYEFIQREQEPGSPWLDLRFDAANATGIFKMTSAADPVAATETSAC
jgi:hypothetical protein